MKKKKVFSLLLSMIMTLSIIGLPGVVPIVNASEIEALLTVDLDPAKNTGNIIHGAAGFLYGVSSENVPTTNTIVPLKSKILVTKGALGTEHPYGDTLDVAKTFLESGGQQVQMYNSNYYGVFGVTAAIEQYCNDLKQYICPAIVEWKEAWKNEHGTPEAPKDNIGKVIDIDKAIVYVPINEGTPVEKDFHKAWQQYYEAIKSVDTEANLAGPNSAAYNAQFTSGQDMKSYIQFCADNNCMPDVITWHELQTWCLDTLSAHMKDFNSIWNEKTNWSKYNEANGTTGIPEIPQICINEYAEMEYCGVPGRLVNWISRLEDEKITGCLPFWHQANNLNDLAASANEGNGAWWLYQWYGNMSGTTQPVTSRTSYDQLYGISTMDENKKISTTLLGGYTGDITVKLNNVTLTETFEEAKYVNVNVQETMFTGFHGVADKTPTIIKGVFPVAEDGSVTVTIPGALFESAYNITLTQATHTDSNGLYVNASSSMVYEAEDAVCSETAKVSQPQTNPSYYISGDTHQAVDMPTNAVLTYNISVPVNGKYRLDFIYGNGQGTVRNDMYLHNPVNVEQNFVLDDGDEEKIIMESTLFQTMTGIKTMYFDLEAGEHNVAIKTTSPNVAGGMLYHDFLRMTYVGVYKQELPLFNRVYEAELADFNKLLGRTTSEVRTCTEIPGYSGDGYVTGLSETSVEQGGGIRYTVVVPESGLYNFTLRYMSNDTAQMRIYVGNTATTLDRLSKSTSVLPSENWEAVTNTIYLEKGINIVDIDANSDVALDYLRIMQCDDKSYSTTIEAEHTIPDALRDQITVNNSIGASNGQYVVGMKGVYENPNYLEFTYNASVVGKYQMQVYHSNEDIAGSHVYNIKAIDKYATFEVNGESDSPKFSVVEEGVDEELELYYFVDCGDHNPSTVSEGDQLGNNNSATDRLYGKDDQTGYCWGVVMEAPGESETPHTGGYTNDLNDHAVYTTYQKALSNYTTDLADGQSKTKTFRYAHGQDTAGILPRYVVYKFELDPKKYDVTVCMGNSWGNASTSIVSLSADGVDGVSKDYTISDNLAKVLSIDLTGATLNENNKVELLVKATTQQATLQMNYITIMDAATTNDNVITIPQGTKVDAAKLPDNIYIGELADGITTFIDYRNVKNSTTRYFFINTFSDDTFREKTVTLNLKEGENKIRIYNDNSWNITYGGTQATPGLNPIENDTPNFDKFVITPLSLEQAISQPIQYNISIATDKGGTAISNVNAVEANGNYTLTIKPDDNKNIQVYINGENKSDSVQTIDPNTYQLSIESVTCDQNIEVYFIVNQGMLEALVEEFEELKEEDYTSNSWLSAKQAYETAISLIGNEASVGEISNSYLFLKQAIAALVKVDSNIKYFVDCGDHNPKTISGNVDDFGTNNSVTDKLYGLDNKTDYTWGLVMEHINEKETPKIGGLITNQVDDDAVYTTYQKALSNNLADIADGKDKVQTLRYAHGQDTAGINPRYISYKFELDPMEYFVTVCMNNTWNNSGNPTVTLSANGVENVIKKYAIGNGNNEVQTMSIDLTQAPVNDKGRVELSVKAISTEPTIQMSYIQIKANNVPEEQEVAVEGVTLDKQSYVMQTTGSVFTLKADVFPENATNKNVTWASSDERVATVINGQVTAVGEGTATVTVKTEDGGHTATCEVKVGEVEQVIPVTGITLDKGNHVMQTTGPAFVLKATISPENATNKNVIWNSSNPTVATVVNGVVTAVAEGITYITATAEADHNYTDSCEVTVERGELPEEYIKVKEVSLNRGSLSLKVKGETTSLVATVLPENATNQNVNWNSSNPSVATVVNGVVRAVANGTTVITVTTQDGGRTAQCQVTVAIPVVDNGENSGGGSDSDNDTTTTPSIPEKANVTVKVEVSEDSIKGMILPVVKVNQQGGVAATVDEKQIQTAISKILEQGKNKVSELQITLEVSQKVKEAEVTLSKEALDKFLATKIQNLILVTPIGHMTLTNETLAQIKKEGQGDVTVTIGQVDLKTLPTQVQEEARRGVYDFTISIGNKTVSAFKQGKVLIEIPYTLARDENRNNVSIYCISDIGNIQIIASSIYDEKTRMVRFVTNRFSTYAVAYDEIVFSDATQHWAKEAIDFVVARKLFSGTTKEDFSPNTPMTRGMVVTVMSRLAGADLSEILPTTDFIDVRADAYYAKAVEWAVQKGIVKGIAPTEFAPDKPLTRAELAVIIANYAKLMGVSLEEEEAHTTFADDSSIPTWAKAAVYDMQSADMISGKINNIFDSQGKATRAEVSMVLKRFIEGSIK